MLRPLSVTTMLPVKDLARARHFYEQALGLEGAEVQADGKVAYVCAGTRLALFPREGGTKAEHTAVSFEDYDFPGLKTHAHVCVLGAEKAAWFMDTEGNCLCLHENLE
jgi:catechol 2,3-dioxygenase-like lactoylglutathione lyase family enzyme